MLIGEVDRRFPPRPPATIRAHSFPPPGSSPVSANLAQVLLRSRPSRQPGLRALPAAPDPGADQHSTSDVRLSNEARLFLSLSPMPGTAAPIQPVRRSMCASEGPHFENRESRVRGWKSSLSACLEDERGAESAETRGIRGSLLLAPKPGSPSPCSQGERACGSSPVPPLAPPRPDFYDGATGGPCGPPFLLPWLVRRVRCSRRAFDS